MICTSTFGDRAKFISEKWTSNQNLFYAWFRQVIVLAGTSLADMILCVKTCTLKLKLFTKRFDYK